MFWAGYKHPGDEAVLRLSVAGLARAGIRAGDLLVATEGGALYIFEVRGRISRALDERL